MEFRVQLSSVSDVKQFVDIAAAFPFDIDVTSERYVVNGKSIMGLFSIDLAKPVTVKTQGGEAEGGEFKKKLGALVVPD